MAFGEKWPLVDATDYSDSSWGERDYHTRVSNFQDFIMTATEGQAVFVWPDVKSIPGDFDVDQLLTASDIDLLSRAIRLHVGHDTFDLNGDDTVDDLDRATWIQDLARASVGDANLDGMVSMDDFMALSAAFGTAGGWAKGDFDGDGIVQFSDFLALSANYQHSISGVTASQVPEPAGLSLIIIAGCAIVLHRPGSRRISTGPVHTEATP